MVESFLPSIRALVAHELRRRKMSQGRIASLLGITQPAVSQCLSKNMRQYKRKLHDLGIDEQEIDRYVLILCEDLLQNPVEGIQTYLSICRGLLSRGYLCEAHRRQVPFLATCTACLRVFGTVRIDGARSTILDQLEKAAKMISASPFFSLIMPEVSVNLVMAVEGAKNEEDVAAFPGRIVRVKNKVQASMHPEFGASHHMAQMLLTAMQFDPNIRAAINLKYDSNIEVALGEMGLQAARTLRSDEAVESDDIVVKSLAMVAERDGFLPPVVIDEGSKGLEPMTYLFEKDAVRVVERAIELSNHYARL